MSENTLNNQVTLKRTLGIPMLVFYGLAFINILGVWAYYGQANIMTHGMQSLAFLCAGVGMVFTGYSYKKMSGEFPFAGSAYTYASKSTNPHAGFLVGWCAMVGYAMLPPLNYALFAVYMNVMIPAIPVWAWITIGIVIIAVINILGVKLSAIVDSVLVVIFAVFILAFIFFAVNYITTGSASPGFSINALVNSEEFGEVGIKGILAGSALLCMMFMGFDAITTLAEETRNPEKNIGRAIMITCIGYAVLVTTLAYLSQSCWMDGWKEYSNPDSASAELMLRIGGDALSYVFSALFALGCFTSNIACITSGSRLLFSMGRDGMLPKAFAKINKRYQTPVVAIIVISILSCTSFFLDIVTITEIANFGTLVAFAFTNLSVIAWFWFRKKERKGLANVVKHLVCPIIGMLIIIMIWVHLEAHVLIVGGIWLLIGIIWLAYNTKMFKELPPELEV